MKMEAIEISNPRVAAAYQAFNTQNFEAVEDYISEDFTYSASDLESNLGTGTEGFITWVTTLTTMIPDWQLSVVAEIEQNGFNATHWIASGNHTGDIPNLPASGNAIDLSGVWLISFDEDGKIAVTWNYFDMLKWLLQTGTPLPTPTSD